MENKTNIEEIEVNLHNQWFELTNIEISPKIAIFLRWVAKWYTPKDQVQAECEEAYQAGKKHGYKDGISDFMTRINDDDTDTPIDVIEMEMLSEIFKKEQRKKDDK